MQEIERQRVQIQMAIQQVYNKYKKAKNAGRAISSRAVNLSQSQSTPLLIKNMNPKPLETQTLVPTLPMKSSRVPIPIIHDDIASSNESYSRLKDVTA